MYRLFSLILCFALAPLLVACGPSDERTFHGYLYYVQGPYLMRFSLRDDSLSMVTHLGNRTIREISPFGENRLLISETASVNRRNVARIAWLDLKTGQSESLYAGVRARFVADAGIIVYDDGGKLYAVALAGGSDADPVIMAHARNRLSAMLTLADGRVLFETLDAGRPRIHAYNAGTGELSALEPLAALCRLDGAVWIDDLDRLLCRERDGDAAGAGHEYVFADLDGRPFGRPALPDGEAFLALAYLEDQGVIVFRERREAAFGGQNEYVVWAHDVRTGENHRLAEDLNLGTSVVYTAY
ncbi:MAG: hypothetical protein P8Y52_10210 [Xanthomonadales bacterium]